MDADGDDVRQWHEIFRSDGLDADGEGDGVSGSQRERNGLVHPAAQLSERHLMPEKRNEMNFEKKTKKKQKIELRRT